MDWRKLVRDKRVWAGAGVVALVGVIALVRRTKAEGGDSGTPGTAGTNRSGSYVQGPGDTTGTDLAGYLSQFFSSQLDAQNEFLKSLKDSIGGGADGGSTTPPPASTGSLAAPGGVHDVSPRNWTDSIQLAWDKVPGAVKYRIKNYAGGDDYIEVGNQNAYQIRDLVHNGSYFWQVQAVDANGNASPWSDYITSHTKN